MIKGYVDKYLQAKVPIAVLDKAGHISPLDAVLDTGFNGQLCISINELSKIDLTFLHSEKFELADGRIADRDVFLGQIIFDGQKRLVTVILSGSRDTLIGTFLLADKKLEIDYPKQSVRIRNSRKKSTLSRQ